MCTGSGNDRVEGGGGWNSKAAPQAKMRNLGLLRAKLQKIRSIGSKNTENAEDQVCRKQWFRFRRIFFSLGSGRALGLINCFNSYKDTIFR